MNKIITVLFILLISDCKAATGNANDGPLIVIVVIVLMLIIVGIGSFIDFLKSKIKHFRTTRLTKKDNTDQNGEFLDSFIKDIPQLDNLSTY